MAGIRVKECVSTRGGLTGGKGGKKRYPGDSNERLGAEPPLMIRIIKAAISSVEGVRLLTPHSTRHTYVSQLQAQGVAIETIQALVGHAEIDMTEHYLHVQNKVKENAVEKLDALFKVS